MGALQLALAALNTVLPSLGSLILAFKHTDGTTSAVVYLGTADSMDTANAKQVADFLAAHPLTPPAPTPPPIPPSA